mmetsp:Transcript_44563/g.135824  ORF Transcript_44563/g.135824 Transcript_44563/m.135824 type:complete len:249 (-) Transcript_44563:581-1327(-)
MYTHLGEGLNVQFGKLVTSVSENGDSVSINCGKDETVSADYVIVTVPLGVLKAEAIQFDPLLLPAKAESISRLEMGNFEKVILVFDEQFWDETFNSKLSLHIGEERCAFPSWFEITGKAGAPTWVCLYDGTFARNVQLEEKWSDDKIIAGARGALAAILGSEELPPHTAARCTHWATDPLSLSSYSYTPVGSSPAGFNKIAKPVWGGKLLFAGEHTIGEYNATVHGPIESGLREANRLEPTAAFVGVE